MDHHDHDMHGGGSQCNMNMLFNWSYQDLCIIFPSWHISSLAKYLFSLLAIIVITAGYEAVREISRRIESGSSQPLALRDPDDEIDEENSSLLWPGRRGRKAMSRARRTKSVRALLYAVQVFYSFFIMLLFMTYNGGVMIAVAVGAFAGYMFFGNSSATKTVACH